MTPGQFGAQAVHLQVQAAGKLPSLKRVVPQQVHSSQIDLIHQTGDSLVITLASLTAFDQPM
jgi:hypothetical protein